MIDEHEYHSYIHLIENLRLRMITGSNKSYYRRQIKKFEAKIKVYEEIINSPLFGAMKEEE